RQGRNERVGRQRGNERDRRRGHGLVRWRDRNVRDGRRGLLFGRRDRQRRQRRRFGRRSGPQRQRRARPHPGTPRSAPDRGRRRGDEERRRGRQDDGGFGRDDGRRRLERAADGLHGARHHRQPVRDDLGPHAGRERPEGHGRVQRALHRGRRGRHLLQRPRLG